MRTGAPTGIIAKNSQDWWRAAIVFLATFLRVFRLTELSEFLGDQGRTMLVMKDFLERGIVPLSGPTTLSGHALGPAFYYLLVPGYLVSGGVIGVTYWVAMLGVVAVLVLYETAKRMFGIRQARVVSLLYAVSPFIIASDRTIWEPNLVPLFAILFLYLLYRAHYEARPRLWLGLGATIGVLLQLHYPNVYFALLVSAYWIWTFVTDKTKRPGMPASVLLVGAGAFVVLLPFLIHQSGVGFRDLLGVASVIRDGGGAMMGKRELLAHFVDYASRVIGRAIPFMTKEAAVLLMALWGLFVLRYPTKRNMFLSVWFFGGTAAMARYSGVVHDHYLYFLVPVPFLMIGSVLSLVRGKARNAVLVSVAVLMVAGSFISADMIPAGGRDIWRVSAAVSRIKAEANGEPFSFTLIAGRSFSDLHYRYFMSSMRIEPRRITDPSYRRLYLICDDNNSCPDASRVATKSAVTTLCYDYHCSGSYPVIPLDAEWKYSGVATASGDYSSSANIYMFLRNEGNP